MLNGERVPVANLLLPGLARLILRAAAGHTRDPLFHHSQTSHVQSGRSGRLFGAALPSSSGHDAGSSRPVFLPVSTAV